jgi:hypothetical protein
MSFDQRNIQRQDSVTLVQSDAVDADVDQRR